MRTYSFNHQKACEAAAQAVQATRRLAHQNPPLYSVALTSRLVDYGLTLYDSKLYSEACEVQAEVVERIRALGPSAYTKKASFRNNVRGFFLKIGSLRVAYAVYSTSSKFSREIHLLSPVQSIIALTAHLDVHGCSLVASELWEKAASVRGECVEMTRDLQKLNPAKYTADATSWGQQYDMYPPYHLSSATDAHSNPSAYALRSSDIETYATLLCYRLYLHGACLQAAGTLSRRAEIFCEAVEWSRQLRRIKPSRYTISSIDLLESYGASLFLAGSYSAASEVLSELVELRRQPNHLRPNDTDEYTDNLAQSLHLYGLSLHHSGSYSAACEVLSESVEMTRLVYHLNAPKYASTLASRLLHYILSLCESGSHEKASEVLSVLVSLERQLYRVDPQKRADKFVMVLHQHALRVYSSGEYVSARKVFSEAADVTRQLHILEPREICRRSCICTS